MMKFLKLFSCFLFLYSNAQTNLALDVNPFIGTGGHGHTFPGAVAPFGMVQLSPDTRKDGSWDGCSGYHFSDSIIYGFSHTHLSGTGVSDWGDILITPANTNNGESGKGYGAKFSHKNETANAGYYSVKFNNGIEAELTTTDRVGIHRYKFTGDKAFVIIDLLHRDKRIDCHLELVDSITINGYRISEAWAKEQYCYFTMKLSKPIKNITYLKNSTYDLSWTSLQKEITEGAIIEFDIKDKKPLVVKVALSNVDNIGSAKNLQAEATVWDFDAYRKQAEKKWNRQLAKINVNEPDQNKKTIFYTSLYHCCIHPSLDMDADGRYRGRDNTVHTAQNYVHYNVFSLWDTYRALHPLFTIIEQKRTNDFINTFYNQYLEGKKLPVWELSSNETNCMIGYHSVSVIADAFTKGIKSYDTLALYKAMKDAASTDEFGIKKFYSKKFLEVNDQSESVSKSLEYAYDNWCIAQMGIRFKDKDVPQLLKTAQAYKNLFDASTGFMRPRINGNWYSPFSPTEINNHYTEGNSWHYSFYVPQDIDGLIKLHGGDAKFEAKLDELFSTSAKTSGREQADVTGLIGQYAHGNEPSHHSAFLYHYIGKPQKTSQQVNNILTKFYKNSPDGLIGNDDCGQMSAWYVLSSLGMYQVCPGNTQLVLFKPSFKEATINFENGKNLRIESEPGSFTNVSGININGTPGQSAFINYSNLIEGGNIIFEYRQMLAANNTFGSVSRPSSVIKDHHLVPTPIINYKSKTFNAPQLVSLKTINGKGEKIYYSTNGSTVTKRSTNYTKPFMVSYTSQVKVKAYGAADSSYAVAYLFKTNAKQIVKIKSKVNPQYSAEGPQSLVDGVCGDTDWRKGDWLGYQGQDVECVIENKDPKLISKVSASFLQDTRSWIVFPKVITIYTSVDGINYKEVGASKTAVGIKDLTVQTQEISIDLKTPQRLKFIKLVAKYYGQLPEWHEGKGGEAFIFIDEIELHE
ncbi:MAG: GH92 family glycosyl hydrolase [Sphingobacteriaceae bacterium]|nr:GH92 family glycosyl hydrolase [Sphingobacteriaceae bacterium]